MTTAWPDRGALRRAMDLAAGLLDAPPPLLVVTDFDGTLSAINPDPLGARIDPLARVALRRLSRLSGLHPGRLRVFVLSGRTALDVAARVRVGGMTYLGNHGLDGGALPAGARAERLTVASQADGLDAFASPARRIGSAVVRDLGSPDWLFVEDKGPSVAFHFRGAADGEVARALVDAAVRRGLADLGENGFALLEGRKVIEVRPASAGGKGATMERLLERERPGSALAMGDDVSDAEAFRVLREGRARGILAAATIAVHGATETPPDVIAAADVVLASPHDAARLLSQLGRELERRLRPTKFEIAAAVPVEVATPGQPSTPGTAPAPATDRRIDGP